MKPVLLFAMILFRVIVLVDILIEYKKLKDKKSARFIIFLFLVYTSGELVLYFK